MTPRTPSSVALFAGGCMTLASLGFTAGAQAEGFVEDANFSLNLRNFYINRNFVDSDYPQSKGEEWTQSFILNFQSGYTPGPVGFGVDALGLLAVKLDGGGGTYGTGLLPVHGAPGDRHPPDDFARLAVAAKAKFSETEVRVGEWMVVLPILRSDDGRSLPQTFQGGMITSKEINGLSLYGGQMRQNSPRDDGSMDDMFYGGASSDRFNLLRPVRPAGRWQHLLRRSAEGQRRQRLDARQRHQWRHPRQRLVQLRVRQRQRAFLAAAP